MTLRGFNTRYAMLPEHRRNLPTPDTSLFLQSPGDDRLVTACLDGQGLHQWFSDYLPAFLDEGGHISAFDIPADAIAYEDDLQVAYRQRAATLVERTGTPVDPASLLHRVHRSVAEIPPTMKYPSGLHYERTEEESNDEQLSWLRPDIGFFAAGACHVLAWAFLERHPNEGFEIVHIRPKSPYNRGHHVIASNGEWVFDYFGWTRESEIINMARASYGAIYPGWDFDRIVIDTDIETFCEQNNHRSPSQFFSSPWERAQRYLDRFGPVPNS